MNFQKNIFFIFKKILLKIITIFLSINEEKIIEEKKRKYEGKLSIFYLSDYEYKIPLGLFLYLILIIFRSIVNLTLKWYMDKKFISHNRMLMVYGLIGTLLYSIICTVTTYGECKSIDNNNSSELSDYICKVNNTDNISLHLENFNTFFNNF